MAAFYRREAEAAAVWAYRMEGHTLAFTNCQAGDRTQPLARRGIWVEQGHPPLYMVKKEQVWLLFLL